MVRASLLAAGVLASLNGVDGKRRVGEGRGHCTSMGWTPDANVEGAGLAAQTDDGEGVGDYRVVFVPAKKHAKGSQRPVYSNNDGVRRLVAPELSPEYAPDSMYAPKANKPLGYVPQVESTYAYYDGDYGLQNDWVSIGESTCSARLYAWPLGGPNGTALFEVEELSRLALERCQTASCSIDVMGEHAEKYGFWSTQSVSDSGESLFVSDSKETWVFHILADTTGKSAIWAAQRVPDGHMAVVANMFIIRQIDLNDKANFRHSKDIDKVATELGGYDPSEGPLDFVKYFSSGEYDHPFYSARRAWRIMSRVAPSLQLDGSLGYSLDGPTYPFSVKPDRKWDIQEIIDLYRDHYEGTPYDLTVGVSAGPFGNPSRWAGVEGEPIKYGAWERSISIYRTVYAHVASSKWCRKNQRQENVLWFGPGRSSGTIFVPLRIKGATSSPPSLLAGSTLKVDQKSLFWAVNAIANWADNKYQEAHNDIRALQAKLEGDSKALVNSDMFYEQSEEKLHEYVAYNTKKAWEFFYELMVKYQNGYIVDTKTQQALEDGYQSEWLKKVGDYEAFQASHEDFDRLKNTLSENQKIADDYVAKRDVSPSLSGNGAPSLQSVQDYMTFANPLEHENDHATLEDNDKRAFMSGNTLWA